MIGMSVFDRAGISVNFSQQGPKGLKALGWLLTGIFELQPLEIPQVSHHSSQSIRTFLHLRFIPLHLSFVL